MLLWLIFAALAGGVLLLVARVASDRPGPDDRDYAASVYRDQLDELGRDEARGLISPAESDAARNEISRRLIATTGGEAALPVASRGDHRMLLVALAVVPLLALGTYLARGNPGVPGLPHAERLANAVSNRDTDALVAQVEAHLAANPQDGAGWIAIGRAYRSLGRFADAAKAFERAVLHNPPDAVLLADYGEALVLVNEGVVTEAAATAFADSLRMDALGPRSRYYQALAHFQDGDRDGALAAWRQLLADAPADAPWRGMVEERIAEASPAAGAPPLTDDQVAAVENLPDADRQAMIRGMVDRLAERLGSDAKDLDGWLRLARARAVLGERPAAEAALARAAELFKEDAAALERIDAMRKSLAP
ncbi:MAG TPA: c-type cytochrome biogenesis protein CcmI [Aestuariivirgaceae bacterium]|nr:c-type cytochrome biogenesis protein CcmI [Aestuariivirgaceae bacterium]